MTTPFPFITGCGRSGTTLMRTIVDTHPDIAIPRESHFITQFADRPFARAGAFDPEGFLAALAKHERFVRWEIPIEDVRAAFDDDPPAAYPDAIRRLFATFAAHRGKPRYGDKTPRYVTEIPTLAAMFGEARFIHVIRDGRDTALSLLEMPLGVRTTDQGALYWAERVRAGREAGRALGPDRYLEYRNEDLIDDPEVVVRRICDFVDLPFDPAMLRYYERVGPIEQEHARHLAKPPTKGLRDWRTDMSPTDARVFELLVGDLLAELGYEVRGAPLAPTDERLALARAKAARLAHGTRTSGLYRALRLNPVTRAAAAAVRPVVRASRARAAERARRARARGGHGA